MAATIAVVASCIVAACGEPARSTATSGVVNGCSADAFVSDEGPGPARIVFGDGYHYEPSCLRVRVGRVIRFEGPFADHPLAAGRIEDGVPVEAPADAGHPLGEVLSGLQAEFVADRPGRFGFYCDLHVAESMMGAIDVVAPGGAGAEEARTP
jgi:plastocyanin